MPAYGGDDGTEERNCFSGVEWRGGRPCSIEPVLSGLSACIAFSSECEDVLWGEQDRDEFGDMERGGQV
jgi:hypothetical protein